ncbi:MAG TPA: hypothetical protein VIO58_04230 [Candidatus Methanoperedens sp.]
MGWEVLINGWVRGTAVDKSGIFNESASNIIQRYDPQADTIEIVLTDAFPYARWYTTAVYMSSKKTTYIFGGHGKNGQGGQILKYDHTTNKVTVIETIRIWVNLEMEPMV